MPIAIQANSEPTQNVIKCERSEKRSRSSKSEGQRQVREDCRVVR